MSIFEIAATGSARFRVRFTISFTTPFLLTVDKKKIAKVDFFVKILFRNLFYTFHALGSCPFSLDKAMEKVYNNLRNVRGALRPKTRMQNPEVRYRMEKSA